ncbi:TRAP transporter small permease subunit [Curvivirga sp.]|uniref:TRAP transporter small permease subunit n=1 Tax=Curvivirga sp. TaxID=2856848 RepID=UPI003B5C33E3
MSEKIQATEDHHLSLADVEHEIHHHTELPSTALSNLLDAFVHRVGAFFSWLWIATVLVIIYSVVSRYVFGQGSVFLEELAWHLAGAAWLVGMSYTLVHDDHVRVDVLHERFSLRTQAWFELFGILILLLPFLYITFAEVLPYTLASFEQGERSQAPAGLPFRWAIKAFMPFSMGLLILAAVSRLLKTTAFLFGLPKPIKLNKDA